MLNYYELSCDGRLKQRSLSHKFLTLPDKIALNSQEDWKTTTVYLINFILSSAYVMISRLGIPASPISFFEKWFFKGFVKQSKLSPTAFCRDEIWLFQRMQECCFQSLILENWIIRFYTKNLNLKVIPQWPLFDFQLCMRWSNVNHVDERSCVMHSKNIFMRFQNKVYPCLYSSCRSAEGVWIKLEDRNLFIAIDDLRHSACNEKQSSASFADTAGFIT